MSLFNILKFTKKVYEMCRFSSERENGRDPKWSNLRMAAVAAAAAAKKVILRKAETNLKAED